MASIGDLFMKVIADTTGLEADVVKGATKAGDKGGKALSTQLGASLKTGAVKAFGLAAAGAFAIASKGALELEEIQARVQAETGASADEAKAVAASINRISGEERASLETVTEAAIKVRKDLGATGEEADKLTQKFVRYGRVTRQDAAGAVKDFDDILDAWGLTAEDSIGIQDKLLASNQKYGGSITENQKALAKMAPQLLALNATVDDGIGLLNLFAASGVDASKAQAALNVAVKNLKPGQNLDDLVKEISSIEDPTKRAQKAIEIFGSKGGVALANALKPGVTSLDAFKVSQEEATGAVDRGADALDNTFSGRIQKKISELGAAIRGVGSDFGPALTGAASLVSLLGSLGAGNILGGIEKLGGKAVGLGKMLGAKIAAGVAGSAILNSVADTIASTAGRIGSAAIGLGRSIGLKIAAGIAGSAAVSALSEGLAGSFAKVGGSSVVQSATSALGTSMGGKFGLAFQIAAVAGIAAIASVAAGPIQDIGQQIHQSILGSSNPLTDIGKAWQDWRKNTAWPIGQKDAPDWASLGGQVDDGLDTAIIQPLDRAADNASTAAEQIPAGMAMSIEGGKPALTAAVTSVAGGITDGKPAIAAALADVLKVTVPFGSDLAAKGHTAGQSLSRSIAEGVKSARDLVSGAMSVLDDALKNEMSPAQERAKLLGELTGKKLAKALHSTDPIVKQAAQDARDTIIHRLEQLVPDSGKIGKKQGAELAKALKSKDPEVRAAAQKIKATIEAKLAETKAKKAGKAKGQEVADGVRSKKGAVGAASLALAKKVAATIIATIKAYGSGGGSRSQARALGGPVQAGVPYLVNENTPNSETFVPTRPGYILTKSDAMAAMAGTNGGSTGPTVHLNTYGLPMYAATPVEVGRQVRRAIKAGTPSAPLRRASWERS